MPSWYRDPEAPTPNGRRGIGVTALIERDGTVLVERRADSVTSIVFRVAPRGRGAPVLSHESPEMRFVPRSELAELEFWPAHRPIRDAYVHEIGEVVIA